MEQIYSLAHKYEGGIESMKADDGNDDNGDGKTNLTNQ